MLTQCMCGSSAQLKTDTAKYVALQCDLQSGQMHDADEQIVLLCSAFANVSMCSFVLIFHFTMVQNNLQEVLCADK